MKGTKDTQPGVCRVSVVVPTYNGASFVAETLQAVLTQTLDEVELIVVDDGSSDGTRDLVASIAPNARLVLQTNAGVSAARNRGLAAASGRYVTFLDQDDLWHPKHLERAAAWLDANPACGAAVCPYHHWRPVSGAYPSPRGIWGEENPVAADPDYSGFVFHQFLVDCWALTSATVIRRELLVASGGFDVSLPYSEDWDLWLRLSLRAPFALLTWPPVLYRQHSVQGSRTVRVRDFRVELLQRYAAAHGLASADGRSISRARFAAVLGSYQEEFGYHHLAHGNRWLGIRSLFAAWSQQPLRFKRLAMAFAATLGWRPRRDAI